MGRWSSLSVGAWCGPAGGKGRTASLDGHPDRAPCHSLWRELWCSGHQRKWQEFPMERESLRSMSFGLWTPNRGIILTKDQNQSNVMCETLNDPFKMGSADFHAPQKIYSRWCWYLTVGTPYRFVFCLQLQTCFLKVGLKLLSPFLKIDKDSSGISNILHCTV